MDGERERREGRPVSAPPPGLPARVSAFPGSPVANAGLWELGDGPTRLRWN